MTTKAKNDMEDDHLDSDSYNNYKTILEIWLNESEFGIDITNRIIYLSGDIAEYTLEYLMKRINIILSFEPNVELPITLMINSFGGDAYEALGIIDYINSLQVKINTICYSKAMSAGAILLLCGTGKRMASKNVSIMLHELSGDNSGKSSDIKINAKHLKQLEDRLYTIMGQKTKRSKAYWEKHLSFDLFFNAQDALKFGLIDEII